MLQESSVENSVVVNLSLSTHFDTFLRKVGKLGTKFPLTAA